MYKIASYLTLEQRRSAVSVKYYYQNSYTSRRYYDKDSQRWYCPLGKALNLGVPGSEDVAQYLTSDYASTERYRVVAAASKRFINDWDSGKVKNLATALGFRGST
mgnify:CR=1 FL=1